MFDVSHATTSPRPSNQPSSRYGLQHDADRSQMIALPQIISSPLNFPWLGTLTNTFSSLFIKPATSQPHPLYSVQHLQRQISALSRGKAILQLLEQPELQTTLASMTHLLVDDKRWQRSESLELFALIGQCMPQLRHLTLRHNQLKDGDAIGISHYLPILQSLALEGNDVGEEGLMSLAERLPKLHQLALGECYLPSQVLQNTLAHFAPLRQLRLIGLRSTAHRLPAILQSQPYLRSLTLQRIPLQSRALLSAASSLRPLQHLALIDNQLTSADIGPVVQGMPLLRHLELQGNPIDDKGLFQLAKHLPQLQRLNLAGTNVTAQGLASFLPQAPQLRWLNVDGIADVHTIAPLLTATFGYNVCGTSR